MVGWVVVSWVKNSDMEPAEAAWCRLEGKEFERGFLNKLHRATHILRT